jgi:acetyl-CoA C-acetyltransferase
MTDGAAGILVVSDRYLSQHPDVAARPKAEILGWGHRTVGLSLQQKLDHSADDPYVLPHVRQTINDAFARAGVSGVDDIDAIETHDCFSMSEYAAIDHFGITAPGDSWKAVDSGELEIGGRIPVNPSGGLIGGGHPVGATGVRMVLDAYKQVTGQAGDYQVDGAQKVATLNIGGSTTTSASFVIGADSSR